MAMFAVLLFAASATAQNWGVGVRGSGPKTTKTLQLDKFDGISLAISGDVFLKQGSTQSVKIEAQQNIIDLLKTEVQDGTWKIGFTKNVSEHDGVKIWITVPSIDKVSVSGSGDVIGESSFNVSGELAVSISGSGSIKLDATSKSMDVAISGSGDMNLSGSTGDCSMRISGSGDISAFGLQADTCDVRISGSGDSSVNVNRTLNVSIAGSGDVYYKGSPSVKSKISGSGDVVSK